MAKSPDAFRTISEVADWLGIPAHVLRFWESKFTQVKPVKRAGGRRYYRPGDMQLLGGIKKLLHDDGLTIKGVQKILRESGIAHVSELSQSLDEMATESWVSYDIDDDRADDASDLAVTEDTGEDATQDTVVNFRGHRKPPSEPDARAGADPAPDPVPSAATMADSVTATESPAKAAVAADPPLAAPAVSPPPQKPRPPKPRADPIPVATDDAPAAAPEPRDPGPGPLTRLSQVRALNPDQARQAAPLAQALREWLDRTAAARAG
jgi:DNA-binding transcriptional MerR regulator